MTKTRALIAVVLIAVVAVAWVALERMSRGSARRTTDSSAPAASTPPATAAAGRKIKARLFYVSTDGARLTGVERDVPYGDGPAAQAQEIVAAQIAPVADPYVSAIPSGTAIRALYVTERGEAYVDLSRDIAAAHTGGSLDELLTVYTIVDALTVNLPAITAVQLLVDGKEVETLAGHVDLRRPLTKNLSWVE